MKILRDIIEIDESKCDGCGLCILSCAEGALQIVDGKARVINDPLCDGIGACIASCPQDALKVIKKETLPFDEEAVKEHLKSRTSCTEAQTMETGNLQEGKKPDSALSNWPIQLRLIPPTAPFLKNQDLLLLADCAAVADPALHYDLIPGKRVLMSCPKLDDNEDAVKRLSAILKEAEPESITLVMMEVPCCAGLERILNAALKNSGSRLKPEEIIVQRTGKRGRPTIAPMPPRLL